MTKNIPRYRYVLLLLIATLAVAWIYIYVYHASKELKVIQPSLQENNDQPLGLKNEWKIVFADDFTQNKLDITKWSTQRGPVAYPYGDPYNPTLEDATYSPDNPTIKDGKLLLSIRKQTEAKTPSRYTSGMIHSGHHFSYTYGFVEARVKIPSAKGTWPAFWTLPTPVDKTWPPEIDIFEFDVAHQSRPTFNYHYGSKDAHKQSGLTPYGLAIDYSQDFHTYGMLWTKDSIQVYLDGAPGPRYSDVAHITEIPQYIVLNLALKKGADVPENTTMAIDYIKVWQKQNQ